jgi:hypothetical protein
MTRDELLRRWQEASAHHRAVMFHPDPQVEQAARDAERKAWRLFRTGGKAYVE